MSIQKALLLFLFGLMLSLVGVLQIMSRNTLLPSYERIESQQIADDVQRLKYSLEGELSGLSSTVKAWAFWDDAYTFVQDRNAAFIKSQLNNDAVIAGDINALAYLNQQGELLFVNAFDPVSHHEIDVPYALRDLLENKTNLIIFSNPDDHKSGIIPDDKFIILISAYPVLKSSAEGPVEGAVVMARFLTDAKMEDWRRSTGYDFSLRPITSLLLSSEQAARLSQGQLVQIVSGKNSLTGYAGVADYMENLSMVFELRKARDTYGQGVQALNLYSVFLLGIGVIFASVSLLVVRWLTISPLTTIRKELNTITSSQDFGRRLTIKRVADYELLATDINQMLETNERLAKLTWEKTQQYKRQLESIEEKNQESEKTKLAMMNILEDQRMLEDQLKIEKMGVEQKVAIRTQELLEEQAKLRGSIDNLPVGFMMTDKNGNGMILNKAIQEILPGHDADALVQLVKVWVRNQKALTLDEATGLPTELVEFQGLLYKSQYLSLSVVPITIDQGIKQGERIGWVVLLDDITEAKALERSRDEFFSIASHELRTPLTAIRGNTAMIRDYYPEVMKDESVCSIITDIHTASLRLIQIVNDFLDASRLELNKIQFKVEPFDIVALTQKVVDAEQALAQEKQISCRLDEVSEQPVAVLADQSRVEQILYNLIGNAVKFTKEGGVSVDIVRNGDGTALVRVTDTGSGIPKENHGLLFRKFQQAGESVFTRDASQGSGMGLYISSLLAQGMHAAVKLESSEVGKGSVFVLELPTASAV